MSKPWNIFAMLGILGGFLIVVVELVIYMITASNDWRDRLTCILLILLIVCLAGIIVCILGGGE